jgi:hypothetical protein
MYSPILSLTLALDEGWWSTPDLSDYAKVWTARESNSGGGETFRTRPDRPWGPHSLLYNGYRFSFPGVKWPDVELATHPHLVPGLKKE